VTIRHHNTNDKVFIIAELSANHNGSLDTALKTIDAMKLQTYTPDTFTLDCNSDLFTIAQDVKEREISTKAYIHSVRQEFGLASKHLKEILEIAFKNNYSQETQHTWELI
jgi:sialic acid synthase SpsE